MYFSLSEERSVVSHHACETWPRAYEKLVSTSVNTRVAFRYSSNSIRSSGVWSSDESPGPYATIGQPHTGPTTFMSEVPSFNVNCGVPPSARIVRRNGGTSFDRLVVRYPSWMPSISMLASPARSLIL